jgi:hypothetical protein
LKQFLSPANPEPFMTEIAAVEANPFALLTHPEVILQAIERSDRLSRLHSRICRPLDKPLIPRVEDGEAEAGTDVLDADIEVDLPPLNCEV